MTNEGQLEKWRAIRSERDEELSAHMAEMSNGQQRSQDQRDRDTLKEYGLRQARDLVDIWIKTGERFWIAE